MTPISARSRKPIIVSVGIESKSFRASSARSTGVLPRLTEYLGPRTELAGFIGRTWPTTSQSKSIRTAARCCLTVGEEHRICRSSIYEAMSTGRICSSSRIRRASHHWKNCPIAWAYAERVFLFRMLAVKNSTKRQTALLPAAAITAGSFSNPRRPSWRPVSGTICWDIKAGLTA